MKKSVGWTRAGLGLAAGLTALGLWGCPNPNAIGVQQYGTVVVICVQAANNQPVAGAIVSIAGVTGAHPTDASGKTTLTQVAIGTHPIEAHAAGLDGNTPTVTVIENTTVTQTVLMSPSL